MDRGHERTEQVISKIEGRLKAEYEQAGKELQETIDDYFARFELKDKKWQEWVKDGKRTQDQYDAWRKQQLMQGERWKKLKEQIAFDMTNANANAREIVRSYMPEVYEINANYALYQIEVGNGYTLPSSLTLYNREAIARMVKDEPDLMPMGKQILGDIARGKAERWERQKVQSIMMQGILQGKSNVRIANDIANNLANGDFKASMRYARTMSTNAQNGGRYGAYRRLEDNGVPLTLQWEATLDMRTRHEHRMMHGQRRNVNQPFVVDGVEILYPAWLGMGDYKVPPDLIWNCRCTLLAWVKGFEHDALRQSERMEGLSYEDWLHAKEKTLPITHQRDVGEAMRMRYIREYGGDGSGLKRDKKDVAKTRWRSKEEYEAAKQNAPMEYDRRKQQLEKEEEAEKERLLEKYGGAFVDQRIRVRHDPTLSEEEKERRLDEISEKRDKYREQVEQISLKYGEKRREAYKEMLGVYDPEMEFSKRATRGTVEDRARVVNEKFLTLAYEYTNNCQRCSIAYELQERGYDVKACPVGADGGVGANAKIRQIFFDGESETYRRQGDSAREAVVAKMKEWGDGARGVITIGRRDGSGHAFNVVNEKGKIRFVDSQCGIVYDEDCYAFDSAVEATVYRTDNTKVYQIPSGWVENR